MKVARGRERERERENKIETSARWSVELDAKWKIPGSLRYRKTPPLQFAFRLRGTPVVFPLKGLIFGDDPARASASADGILVQREIVDWLPELRCFWISRRSRLQRATFAILSQDRERERGRGEERKRRKRCISFSDRENQGKRALEGTPKRSPVSRLSSGSTPLHPRVRRSPKILKTPQLEITSRKVFPVQRAVAPRRSDRRVSFFFLSLL